MNPIDGSKEDIVVIASAIVHVASKILTLQIASSSSSYTV